jgi:hypothetical protein
MAQRFEGEPGLLGVLLLGSTVEETCDSASDVDMALYWEAVPPFERLDAVKAEYGSGERFFLFGDPGEGGCVEAYRVDGMRHDFAHCTPESWHAQTDDVLLNLNVDSLWQKGMHGTLHGEVLSGGALIEEFRARIRAYPDTLQLAMLQRYCTFTPEWTIEHQARRRGDLLFYYDLLVKVQTGLLFTLCALNRVYHAMEFKRLHRFVARELPLAPRDLAARLDSLLAAGAGSVPPDLGPLVEETLDLVAEHCPEFDIAPARKRWQAVAR